MLREFEYEYNRISIEIRKENERNQALKKQFSDSQIKLIQLKAILEYIKSLKDIEKEVDNSGSL